MTDSNQVNGGKDCKINNRLNLFLGAGLVLLILTWSGDIRAGEKYWWSDRDNANHLWNNPKNWLSEGEGVPGSDDIVFIGKGDFWARYPAELLELEMGPVAIGSGANVQCNWLLGPAGGAEARRHYELNITGGSLTIGGAGDAEWMSGWYIGCIGGGGGTGGGSGTVNISGGKIIVHSVMRVGGWGGTGTVNMTGGTIVAGKLYCPYNEGTGYINLKDGIIVAGDLIMDHVLILGLEGKALIDIAGGELKVFGNRAEKIREYVEAGRIVAYGGRGKVFVEYVSPMTRVRGEVESAVDAEVKTVEVKIDCSRRLQQIDGFGSSVVGFRALGRGYFDEIFSKGVTYKTTAAQRKEMIEAAVRELGVDHLRVWLQPAGIEQVNDNDDPAVMDWDAFTWEGNTYKPLSENTGENRQYGVKELGEILSIAVSAGLNNWIVAPGGAPRWLIEKLNDAGDPMRFEEYAEWAAAHLVYLKREFGLEAPYWSMFNEPDPLGWRTADFWIPWIKATGQRFRKEGLKTMIMIPDSMNVYDMIEATEEILEDEDARQYIGALAYHHYRTSYLGARPFLDVVSRAETADEGKLYEQLTNGARAMAELGRRYGLPSWQTEAAYYPKPVKDENMSPWDVARARANENYYELVSGASAIEGMLVVWVDAVDPRYDYPVRFEGHHIVMSTDGDRVTKWEVTKDCGGIFAHYGRYVRAGDYRVGAGCEDKMIRVTAFAADEGRRYVSVVINNAESPRLVRFNLKHLPWKPVFAGGLLSDEKRAMVAYPIHAVKGRKNAYESTLPALSVCTFVWSPEDMGKLTLPEDIKFR